jgi:hypothetical protein
MAKVQLLHRLRLVPGPAPIVATPAPTAKPIAPVQDADRRTLSFQRGPAPGARFTPDYVSEIARFAYFWAWPLVNVFNRYIAFKRVRRPILVGGIAPVAPINHVAMLHDYIGWKQRYIACPSQDLIYGFGILDLAREPVVVQVPDFGKRYWVYQATDLRTDGFANLGTMYGTKPGFYLLSGPDWDGKAPSGIAASFRGSTNVATLIPRVFQEDDKADNEVLQPLIQEIAVYPLSEFDGKVKTRDWSSLPSLPWIKLGEEEWKWVDPATFFDILPEVLDAARPLPGEEALYALVRSVLHAAAVDKTLRKVLKDAAAEADETLVKPLLQFRNFGIPLPDNWTTVINSAEFGTDYYTRTAVAKSNIFINRPRETRFISIRTSICEAGGSLVPGDTPSPLKRPRPSKASGRSPSITGSTSSRRTRSIVSRSAPRARACASSLTALSSSMCRTSRQPTTSYRTGYLLRLTNSRFTFASIGLSRKLPRDAGLRLRSSPLRHHSVTMT